MKESVKRILVPLDPTVFAEAATETACHIALVHGAQVTGAAVLDSAEIRSSVVPAVGPYYPFFTKEILDKTKHAEDILKDCKDRFSQTCEKMGVTHLETEYEGIPVQKLLESAIFHDLVVIGLKTAFHFETRKESIEPLNGILERTVTPILAVPACGLEKPEKVLIAFDGSMGASRAMHDFARFAGPFDPSIKIVTAEMDGDESQFLLKNAASFLQSHGLRKVETECLDTPINDAVDAAADDGVNLVVAGIHSKKVIQDMFVGSFTKSLIARGDLPLFLSH